jgi:phosphatidylinositol alpha-1,6-mannosyltransferase
MRVVFFAKRHKRSGITLHMRRALEALGHDVLAINKHRAERLLGSALGSKVTLARARRFRPDVVLVFTFDADLETVAALRASGARVATFFDDCPPELDERILRAGRTSDVFFINNRGQIPLYEKHGIRAVFATGGTDPTDHVRVAPVERFAADVSFIGKADRRGGRVDLVLELARRFKVKVYGQGWRSVGLEPELDDVYPEQYRAICASSKVMLGCDLRDDVELYFSNRTWITLGCGGFLCTRYVPKLEELLEDGVHLAWYRTIEEAPAIVAKYLSDDALRTKVQAEGHRYAHERFSYEKMIEAMLAEVARPAPPAPRPPGPLRIGVVTSQLPPDLGGTSVYAHEIARGLGRLGDRPLVLIRDRDPVEFAPLGLEVEGVSTRQGLLKPLRLRRARRAALERLRDRGVQVVLFAYTVSGWGDLYSDLARAGVPYAVSIHGVVLSELENERRRARRRAKWGVAGASLVFANTRWMAEQVQRVGVPAEKLAVVYLGVDPAVAAVPDEAVRALRAKLGLEGKRAIVSVARITPRKNHDALLRALATLAPRHRDLIYLVVGDGHARPALEEEARRLGVADRVRFVGAASRSEVGAYYKLARVHALVPKAKPDDNELESFGLCYVEAALCGVPSVGSRSGGVPEAVADGETGLLVEADDEGAVASALERLLEDDALHARLAGAAAPFARERFSWDRCARETREALARVARPG